MVFNAALNRTTAGCPTDLLHFDASNPRLDDGIHRSGAVDDATMIRSLKDVAALSELIASICANDYKDIEPLIVMAQPDAVTAEEGPFTVLEGNRRLACIKLIKDRALAESCGITIPDPLRPSVLPSLESVSVYRVASESDARAFIGFKHINGPHRWDSFAKAKYVTQWFKQERAAGLTIEKIAAHLGDDNNTIRSMISGMLVLEQAEALGFDMSDRFNKGRFAFSHLYTALSRGEYMEFLELPRRWMTAPADNPVPPASNEKLLEVMGWLYGSKARSKPPLVRSQNPDLANLGDVLKHPVAIRMIRAGKSLSEALGEIRPPTFALSDVMVEADAKLREGVQLAGRAESVDGGLLEIGVQIGRQATALNLLLANLPRSDAVAEGQKK